MGPPVVLMHGLSATRRNVVQGSKLLPREGHRVVSDDARGHGASSPAPGDYAYSSLVDDLWAVMDDRGIDRAALVGSSMGRPPPWPRRWSARSGWPRLC